MVNKAVIQTLALIGCCGISQAGVVNGNFETACNGQLAPGWTTSSGVDGSGGCRATGGNPNGNFILNAGGDPATDPTISQDIGPLILTHLYQLTGDFACGNVCNPPQTTNNFAVDINGTTFGYMTPTALGVWRSFTIQFTYSGASTILNLRGETNGTDYDPRVDNIVLTDITGQGVPEPSAWMLVAAGIAAISFAKSRK